MANWKAVENLAYRSKFDYRTEKLIKHLVEDFGVIDKAGRKIGAQAHVFQVEVVEQTNPNDSYVSLRPGTYYKWHGHQLRAGWTFGSGSNGVYTNREAALTAALTYLRNAGKRAEKQYAEQLRAA